MYTQVFCTKYPPSPLPENNDDVAISRWSNVRRAEKKVVQSRKDTPNPDGVLWLSNRNASLCRAPDALNRPLKQKKKICMREKRNQIMLFDF